MARKPRELSEKARREQYNLEKLLAERAATTPPAPPEDPLQPKGVNIISAKDLQDAIALDPVGAMSDYGTLGASAEEGKRLRLYMRWRTEKWQLFKNYLYGSKTIVGRLNSLMRQAPNFSAVIELALAATQSSRLSGRPLHLPPILLLGPPGVGKSRFSTSLARALGTRVARISAPTLADRGTLTGHGPSWLGAGPGLIAKTLFASAEFSPVILVDEVDKFAPGPRGDDQISTLLPLMERETSKSYVDEYIQLPMRADGIIWILTANEISPLPEPLLDRMLIFTVPELSSSQQWDVIQSIISEVIVEHNNYITGIEPVVFDMLMRLNFRQTRRMIEIAISHAIAAQRRTIQASDIELAMRWITGASKTKIGFFP